MGKGEVAVEVKIGKNTSKVDLKGMTAFMEEHTPKQAIVVSTELQSRIIETAHGQIKVLPWELFLDKLWNEEIIS